MVLTPETRLQRVEQIERRLVTQPMGFTASELAREFGVSKPTILRDLVLLEHSGVVLLKDGYRYVLNKQKILHALKLSIHELLAIYLAVRLLSRHSDEHNPHIVTALEKLADALRERSPFIAQHIDQAAAAVRSRKIRKDYVEALEALTQGWAEGKKVRIRYRSYTKDEVTERLFAPLFFEPVSIGYACYVIGFDYLRNEIRTFKIERISEASCTEETFDAKSTYDLQKIQRWLASAWGIIWHDEGDIEVTLHFSPSVVRRVKESTWHYTQRIDDVVDGSCLFRVKVGSTKELLSWVRGWGSDVEVLEPQSFREEMQKEARTLAHLYGIFDRPLDGNS